MNRIGRSPTRGAGVRRPAQAPEARPPRRAAARTAQPSREDGPRPSLERAARLGHRPALSHDQPMAVRRRLGLEMEMAVPIDKLGKLARRDERVLAGTVNDVPRRQELMSRADAGYGKFHKAGLLEFHADHSSRVGQYASEDPPRTLGSSILELVTKPVETEDELREAIDKALLVVDTLEAGTDHLTRRTQLVDEYWGGPLNSEAGTPPGIGYDAAVQVNIGVDVRNIGQLFDFYRTSAYRPRSSKLAYVLQAQELAHEVTEGYRQRASESQLSQAQNFNGIEGLLTLLAMYLYAGNQEGVMKKSVKNFTPILVKSRFHQIKEQALTSLETKLWNRKRVEIARALLDATRGGVDPAELLIKATKPDGAPKSNYTVKHLFSAVENDVAALVVGKERPTEQVGPERSSDEDRSLSEGQTRRSGPILEIRGLGGNYKPGQWLDLALTFFRKAQQANQAQDY